MAEKGPSLLKKWKTVNDVRIALFATAWGTLVAGIFLKLQKRASHTALIVWGRLPLVKRRRLSSPLVCYGPDDNCRRYFPDDG